MDINTPKVIQIVKFHISHQMKSYSSVKTICGSSYTCFSMFGVGASWGDWTQIASIIGTNTQKVIHGVKLHISHNETLLKCKGHLRVNLYLICEFAEMGQVGET